MKKALVAFLSIVLIGMLFIGCPTDPNDPNSGGSNGSNLTDITTITETDKVGIGLGTIIYASISEVYLLSADDVPGISGTLGSSVQWDNFDLGAIDPDDEITAGETVIVSGTHETTVSGTTQTNSMDITIRFNTEDTPGTYRVVYVTRTTDYESVDASVEIITFTVNGSNVDLTLLPD